MYAYQLVQDNNNGNMQAIHYWHLCREITDEWYIPFRKSHVVRRRMSMWWCHYIINKEVLDESKDFKISITSANQSTTLNHQWVSQYRSNIQPISLLSCISKLFENVVYSKLYEYLSKNKHLYENQCGFRTKHSTELPVIELIDRILINIDDKNLPFAISVDLSKAFDTLAHKV